jgi:hypothetical protein
MTGFSKPVIFFINRLKESTYEIFVFVANRNGFL